MVNRARVEAKRKALSTKFSAKRVAPRSIWQKRLVTPAAVLTLLGGLWTFASAYIDKIRLDSLATTSAQLEKLYGPLYAYAKASDAVWGPFRELHLPSRRGKALWIYCAGDKPAVTSEDAPSTSTEVQQSSSEGHAPSKGQHAKQTDCKPESPTTAEVTEWRAWMKSVFQPLNVAMEKAITGNTHLVIGSSMPKPFLELVEHTEGYKETMDLWTAADADKENYSDRLNNLSLINYPDILPCAQQSFELLKARQLQLSFSPLPVFGLPLPPPCACVEDSAKYEQVDWEATTRVRLWSVVFGSAERQLRAWFPFVSYGKAQCVRPGLDFVPQNKSRGNASKK
ncbi:hypothetical protein ACMX25_36510 [Caballeronia sp. 15715]|uniref:hypothetical protein n=1 Tax=Caballeronia sp. 15715 TaxID=3391030 RepID=UPI0039E5D5AB